MSVVGRRFPGVFPYPDAPPERPTVTTPWSFLRWLTRRQLGLLIGSVALGAVYALSVALTPAVLGIALDIGLQQGLTSGVLWAAGGLAALGIVYTLAAAFSHALEVRCWMSGAFDTIRVVSHHVTHTGAATTKRRSTGEIAAVVTSDAHSIGNLFELLQGFIGALVAFLVVSAIMLATSPVLGLVVLIGTPVVAGLLGLLMRPLKARQEAQRAEQGKLTAIGVDTVAGLRVLRGIGGEDAFAARYAQRSQAVRATGVRVARLQSWIEALQVLLPGAFTCIVMWLGARQAMAGQITAGDLVAFFGYTSYLQRALRSVTYLIQFLSRAVVGAEKAVDVLRTEPAAGTLTEREDSARAGTDGGHSWMAEPPEPPAGDPDEGRAPAALSDDAARLDLTPGAFTAIVAEEPEESAELLRRLARRTDDDAAGVRLDGQPILTEPIEDVRRRVVLADSTPELFAATLRDSVAPPFSAALARSGRDVEAYSLAALHTADAHDVLDSLPAGLHGEITEKGRSLSGGQRQRVALARALAAAPDALLLIEPTSSVDAPTEARIAQRTAELRRGRTTVVATASPLVLDHAQEVVLLADGVARARGPHRDLLARAAAGARAARRARAGVARSHADDEEEAR